MSICPQFTAAGLLDIGTLDTLLKAQDQIIQVDDSIATPAAAAFLEKLTINAEYSSYSSCW